MKYANLERVTFLGDEHLQFNKARSLRHDDQWGISIRDDPHKSEARCSHTHLSGLACQDILYSHSDLRLEFKNTTNWQAAYLPFITHLIHIICYTSTKQNTTQN